MRHLTRADLRAATSDVKQACQTESDAVALVCRLTILRKSETQLSRSSSLDAFSISVPRSPVTANSTALVSTYVKTSDDAENENVFSSFPA